jgi:hypothetical protein
MGFTKGALWYRYGFVLLLSVDVSQTLCTLFFEGFIRCFR